MQFLDQVVEDHPPQVGLMAVEFVRRLERGLLESPWSLHRDVEWLEVKSLAGLRDSPELDPERGRFLDQRFIDYLQTQPQGLDAMHWRKFEGLTAEFFDRRGFRVEIGPGRDDDGVDIRIWADAGRPAAPLYLVQCKRQRQKVGKVIVKALWADVVHEGATEGVIATTSALQPGAQAVIDGRRYRISSRNRDTVERWLTEMRTPGRGVFMAR